MKVAFDDPSRIILSIEHISMTVVPLWGEICLIAKYSYWDYDFIQKWRPYERKKDNCFVNIDMEILIKWAGRRVSATHGIIKVNKL